MELSISLIIMAYNEALNLGAVVREITMALESTGRQYEIIIINDGSSDATGLISDKLGEQNSRIRPVHHPVNQGLGGVYRTGFAKAKHDLITFFPADGQFPASIIRQFLPLMDDADMVLGYLPNREASFVSKSLSTVERLLYKYLLGKIPELQGVFMFRRAMLAQIELHTYGRGWAVVWELIIRAFRGGYRIVNVPTGVRPRLSGKSKVNNLSTIVANLKQVILLRRNLRF